MSELQQKSEESTIRPGEKRQKSEDLIDRIVTRLEEDIVFGRLHPRERLVEEDIALRFDAKRHVVRQALVKLESLGLVDRHPNRGAVVRLYTAKQVEDINAVRELLESRAASLVPLPLPPKALALLDTLQKRHHEAVLAGDGYTVFRANIDFHQTLFSFCGNDALIEAINTFAQKSHAYRHIFVNDRSYLLWAAEDHARIVAAAKAGDREAFVEHCRNHLAPAKNFYVETYRSRFAEPHENDNGTN
ncbi:GntR family transcriptional regulator [Fulvimarina endophytica]|uniref:GntR family transcriptional regulator n=1 Tax=Fulvimarina endophytica TaxID=2293836 RepID=A0A371X0K5_9HYPH|nr:GntR family transcriptional regulator [Fulvimarina endophytica]RFC62767.1 GntR family transcriptional regulator [Fulvimarina endophytica]